MKRFYTYLTALAFIGSVTFATRAAETVRLTARPGSKVVILGTSSIHDWEVVGRIIGGSIEIEKSFLTDKTLQSVKSLQSKKVNPKVRVIIPVRSLKSGKQKMDGIMREAMRAKNTLQANKSFFGAMEYRNQDARIANQPMVIKGKVPPTGSPVKFDVTGKLTVAGVTKPIQMEVTMERLGGNKFKFKGEKKMKMTDFDIIPPSPKIPGLQVIHTGNEVTVKFEWIVGARTK